jgi:hypothetical protein
MACHIRAAQRSGGGVRPSSHAATPNRHTDSMTRTARLRRSRKGRRGK